MGMTGNIIEIRDFTFTYPGQDKEALSHVSMEVGEGSMCVLCGRSGCGKSTLMRQLKSDLSAHGRKSGRIFFGGRLLESLSHREQSSQVGFVLQNPDNQIVTDKVWHELAFGLESLGYDNETIRLRVAEMANYFGIHKWFMKNVSELSGGQKQLLNLASIMAMHPRVLLLDEPTSQLDPIAASDFLGTVRKINREVGTTVLITEHRLQDVLPYADKAVVMEGGRLLAQGTPEEVGRMLKGEGHGMFLSMPVPMQIYASVDSDAPCPLTVSEGRKWITELMTARGKAPVYGKDMGGVPDGAKGQPHGCCAPGAGEVQGHGVLRAEKGQIGPGIRRKGPKEPPAVDMQDIWFRYERDAEDVVRGLSLQVQKGEFYTLAGGNGAGKSTALSLLSRVRKPYRGKIFLNGKDIRRYSDRELYRGCLGVLPQNPQSMFIKKTVREDLYAIIGGAKEKRSYEYPLELKKEKAVEGMVELTDLHGLLDRHPYDLSGGEQQRLALAKVLLMRPWILLLDEPTKGLDAQYKETLGGILRKLKAHGITILMVSHDVEFAAEYSDRVGLFFEGNVVTSKEAHAFFAGNSFYTTAANRMARHYFPEVVTGKEVAECLRRNL